MATASRQNISRSCWTPRASGHQPFGHGVAGQEIDAEQIEGEEADVVEGPLGIEPDGEGGRRPEDGQHQRGRLPSWLMAATTARTVPTPARMMAQRSPTGKRVET